MRAELQARRRGERDRAGGVALAHSCVALQQREDREPDRHGERDEDAAEQDALAPRRCTAARVQVALLELGRPRVVRRVLVEDTFRLGEVLAAEQQAGVSALLPVDGAHEQSRVRPRPLEVGVERGGERGERRGAVVGVAAKDPVELAQRGRRVVRRRAVDRERHDSLAPLARVTQLAPAVLGRKRRRAGHEDEALGAVDRPVDVAFPLRRGWDVLPIHPDLAALALQEPVQLADEVAVAAGVRDEDVEARHRRIVGHRRRSFKGRR